jgi:uncharacterized OB-fold protein
MVLGNVVRDDTTGEFFDGAARGEFLIRHCPACGCHLGPQAQQCHSCGSARLAWIPASGDATVVSWTVTHARPAADGTARVAVLAVAELAEGPWWWSRIAGVDDPARVSAGTPLRIGFERPAGSEAIPVFRLAEREA